MTFFLVTLGALLTNSDIISNQTTCDQHCLITVLLRLPQFFLHLNLKLMPVPQRWAEVLTLPLSVAYLCHIKHLLSLLEAD
jgi:hypothetical protein